MLDHLTECECSAAGWCKRHGCEKDQASFEMCRRFANWFELWERGQGPEQRLPQSKSGRLENKCVHRGPPIRAQECPTCQGRVVLKVFRCEVHQECAVSRRLAEIACCEVCQDYRPVQSSGLESGS